MRNYKGTYNGNTLAHYRTKGSRNGYSKDPNYTPIGEKARGPEQHPVYGGAVIAGVGEGVYKRRFDNVKAAPARVTLNALNANEKATRINNMKAAEARRIAGSKLGSGYVDSGAGNFRRGMKLAGQAIKERMNPNHKQRSMNKHYGEVINETVSKYHAKQAAKEIGTGVKKGANYAVNEGKSLVKKGKKKVKSLMKRFFG